MSRLEVDETYVSNGYTIRSKGYHNYGPEPMTLIENPKVLWIVEIPSAGKNGYAGITIHYSAHLNWWQRMWMKFIGWGVKKPV